MCNRHANIQHIDLKVPLFGRGGISEDLKSILITVRYSGYKETNGQKRDIFHLKFLNMMAFLYLLYNTQINIHTYPYIQYEHNINKFVQTSKTKRMWLISIFKLRNNLKKIDYNLGPSVFLCNYRVCQKKLPPKRNWYNQKILVKYFLGYTQMYHFLLGGVSFDGPVPTKAILIRWR